MEMYKEQYSSNFYQFEMESPCLEKILLPHNDESSHKWAKGSTNPGSNKSKEIKGFLIIRIYFQSFFQYGIGEIQITKIKQSRSIWN